MKGKTADIDILEEKEKEAIKDLEEYLHWEELQGFSMLPRDKHIETLLNLVSNLIAENKELKEMLKHRIEYTNKLEKDLFENCSNYVVSKDKIKAKIEPKLKELDKNMKKEWQEYGNSREYQDMEDEWNFLQSLLGKE